MPNNRGSEERRESPLDDTSPDDNEPIRPRSSEMPAGYSEWAGTGTGGRDDGDYNLEAFVSAETTLADWLREQMALAIADPVRRMIAQYLIDLVDESGYLAGDLAAAAEKLGTTHGRGRGRSRHSAKLRSAGHLRARPRRMPGDPAQRTRSLRSGHGRRWSARLDLLARRDFAALKKICGVGDEDLAEHDRRDPARSIRSPDSHSVRRRCSRSCRMFSCGRRPSGAWIVELNTDTLPKVLVNQRYYAEVSSTARRDTEKSYLAECLQSATWLVRALDQRARTILKVSNEIVRQQDGFFAHGVEHLRPLNLKTVAEAIGMHESTVSRVTANKYMATTRGIFELKYFFTSAIAASHGGEAHSAEAVRHRIKQLIDGENPADILSDDTLVEKLREAGIDIARRTVAKYREAMRIPSSVQRRREKQAAAAS